MNGKIIRLRTIKIHKDLWPQMKYDQSKWMRLGEIISNDKGKQLPVVLGVCFLNAAPIFQ